MPGFYPRLSRERSDPQILTVFAVVPGDRINYFFGLRENRSFSKNVFCVTDVFLMCEKF